MVTGGLGGGLRGERSVGVVTHQGSIDGVHIVTERLACPGDRPAQRRQL